MRQNHLNRILKSDQNHLSWNTVIFSYNTLNNKHFYRSFLGTNIAFSFRLVTTRNHNTLSTALESVEALFWLDTFLFPSFSICLYLFVSQAAGSLLKFKVKPLMKSLLKSVKDESTPWSLNNSIIYGSQIAHWWENMLKHYVINRHRFTAKQVEVYYLDRIFWNLKNAKKEAFIHQITLADPRLQHLDMYSSTAADFEQ